MNDQPIPFVNLIPAERVLARKSRVLTLRWVVAGVMTAFFVGLPGAYIGGSAVFSDSAISTQIEQSRNQLVTNQNAIPVLEKQLQTLLAEQEVLDLVQNRVEWPGVLGAIVDASDDQVRFISISIVGSGVEGEDPVAIQLNGIAPSQTIARAFVVRIESMGLFDQVQLTSTSRREIEQFEVVEFEISMRVGSEKGESTDG